MESARSFTVRTHDYAWPLAPDTPRSEREQKMSKKYNTTGHPLRAIDSPIFREIKRLTGKTHQLLVTGVMTIGRH
jgi:hypothetical protein